MEKELAIGLNAELKIREVLVEDAESVAALSASFGYPTRADEMRSRIKELAGNGDRIAFAVVLHDEVVGWIDSAVERHLQSPPIVVIGGLVVRGDMRGKRIGHLLCQTVEQWAVQIGIVAVRVRSQLKRADAHRFYLRDGFKQVKVSAVFEKNLFPHTRADGE